MSIAYTRRKNTLLCSKAVKMTKINMSIAYTGRKNTLLCAKVVKMTKINMSIAYTRRKNTLLWSKVVKMTRNSKFVFSMQCFTLIVFWGFLIFSKTGGNVLLH